MGEKRKLKLLVVPFFAFCILVYSCVSFLFEGNSPLRSTYHKIIRDAKLFDDDESISLSLKAENEKEELFWTQRDSYNTSDYIHAHKLSMIHEPRIPRDVNVVNPYQNSSPKTQILIFCHSAPHNFIQRNTIRETWGTNLDILPMTLIFLIGQTKDTFVQNHINMEAAMHEDILQEHFLDSYDILSIKSVFMLKYLKHLLDSKVPIHFVLKMDDDCSLNPLALFKFTSIVRLHPFTIFGRSLGHHSPVIRPKTGGEKKWAVAKFVYKEDYFPNAASGSGYLFDVEAGLCLFRKALEIPFINLEDIYLTGILRTACKIDIRNSSKFHFMGKKVCDVRKSDILIHRVKDPRQMYKIHEVLNGITVCKQRV